MSTGRTMVRPIASAGGPRAAAERALAQILEQVRRGGRIAAQGLMTEHLAEAGGIRAVFRLAPVPDLRLDLSLIRAMLAGADVARPSRFGVTVPGPGEPVQWPPWAADRCTVGDGQGGQPRTRGAP